MIARDPDGPGQEPDLLRAGADTFGRIERAQIALIKRSLEPGPLDSSLRWCQRTIGARWINTCLANLRHVHGVERLPHLAPDRSFLLVSNHRSFFDLYTVTSFLVARGLTHRILFPVRSNFWYDHPLGPFVNFAMSFLAMYPPIYRSRERAALNLVGLDELAQILRRGGALVGIHPEGARKKDDDPYTFLPAQSGVGRLIHHARATVLPVFVNGLGNDIARQIASNFTRTGAPVHVVFGAPVEFGGLLDRPGSPRTYRAISERTLEVVGVLGQEERAIRARSEAAVQAPAASRANSNRFR